ncbi:proliferation marker protein Ki-67-like isoform X2 [Biomphalaria glabrata]|uniref:Proliferation marker protein Ki-67-like isoform X2 n=1 Tax=Biomphalaria glabrata TaxID=6526 RepID=A0A9W2ZF66_BIOGL|nr:proliferation marker protein Ki-67-like isoform X2 [Biomphalaria glabrata]
MFGKIVVIKRTGADGAHFPLTLNTCLFGRGQHCDIRIQMPDVENEQCVVNVDEKGHVFLTNLSKENPTHINDKALAADCLTALSHGDIITIIDRKFRFEFPSESQFYPKSPRAKSPKSPRKSIAVGESVVGLKSPAKSPQKTPRPLTPRTENVPGLKRLSEAQQHKFTSVQGMTPGTSFQAASPVLQANIETISSPLPGKKTGGTLYTRTNESLQKSINLLKRRSMPLFERDEESKSEPISPEVPVIETNKSITQDRKRKSSTFVMLNARNKRVSFGPSLSPEHFDKTLPPKTPIKRGATPTRLNPGRKSLLKRQSPKSLALRKTPSPRRSSSNNVNSETASQENRDESPFKQGSAKKSVGKRVSSASPLPVLSLEEKTKEVITPVQVQSPRGSPRSRSLTPILQAENVTPLSSKRENSITPKSSLANRSLASITDSPFLSQDLFSQKSPVAANISLASEKSPTSARKKSPVAANTSLASEKSPTSAKKKSAPRGKSEGPQNLIKDNLNTKRQVEKRARSLGTIPLVLSPLSSFKAKHVRLSGPSPISVVTYKKTPVVKRAGKKSGDKTDLINKSVNLTGIKELVKTPKALSTNDSFSGLSDLFTTPAGKQEAAMNTSADLLNVSGKHNRTPRKSLVGIQKEQLDSSLSGMSSLFKTPVNNVEASLNKINVEIPKSVSAIKRACTPDRNLTKTPVGQPVDVSFSGMSNMFSTPTDHLDELDGHRATANLTEVVNTPALATPTRSRTPNKTIKSPQAQPEDISFTGISDVFKSPDVHMNTSQSRINTPKSLSNKKSAKAKTPIAAESSLVDISELFKTPIQHLSEAKQSTPKSEVISEKRSRTPKKFFDEISPLSSYRKKQSNEMSTLGNKSPLEVPLAQNKSTVRTPMSQKKSPLKTPMSQKKSPIKTPLTQKKSPLKTPLTQKKSPLKTPMSQKKSPIKTPLTQKKSPLKTPLTQKKSSSQETPLSEKTDLAQKKTSRVENSAGKIKSPPQDKNKVVALRAIHAHVATPKFAALAKSPSATPRSSRKMASVKKTIRTWSDIVKSGVPKSTTVVKPSVFISKVTAAKKTHKIPLKQSVKTPKTPRALARALAPTTGHAESPATILVGKKLTMRAKTPKLLPRKGRKQSASKMSRVSVGNTSFSGLPDMFKTPEATSSADTSALYDQIPDTPNGPNEMFVSPLSETKEKRRSANLVGVRELFTYKKRQSMNLVGVKELMKSPKLPGRHSLSPTALTRLMKTPHAAQKPSQSKSMSKISPVITPSGLKRMMKVPTYVSPSGVETLFTEVKDATPKSSRKGRLSKTPKEDASGPKTAPTENENSSVVSNASSEIKQTKTGRKRKAGDIAIQAPLKKMRASSQEIDEMKEVVAVKKGRGRKMKSPEKTATELDKGQDQVKITYEPAQKNLNAENAIVPEKEEVSVSSVISPVARRGRPKANLKVVTAQEAEPKPTAVAKRHGRGKALSVNVDLNKPGLEESLTEISSQDKFKDSAPKRGRGKASSNLMVVTTEEVESQPTALTRRQGHSKAVSANVDEQNKTSSEVFVAPSSQVELSVATVKRGRRNVSNLPTDEFQPEANAKLRGRKGILTVNIDVSNKTGPEESVVPHQAEPTIAAPKRGRGRLASNKTILTDVPGKASPEESVVPHQAEPTIAAPKRGRGRLASNKTVLTDVPGKASPEESVVPHQAEPSAPTRGRGRSPSKKTDVPNKPGPEETEPTTAPKRGGRRAAQKDEQPDLNSQDKPKENLASVSKRRGKGKDMSTNETVEIIEQVAEPQARKGRGKVKISEPVETVTRLGKTSVSDNEPVKETILTQEPVKSKRRTKAPESEQISKSASIKANKSKVKFSVSELVEAPSIEVATRRGRNETEPVPSDVKIAAKKGKGNTVTASSEVDTSEVKSTRTGRGKKPSVITTIEDTVAKIGLDVEPVSSSSDVAVPAVKSSRLGKNKAASNVVHDIPLSIENDTSRGKLKADEPVTSSSDVAQVIDTTKQQENVGKATKQGRGRRNASPVKEQPTPSSPVRGRKTGQATKQGRGRRIASPVKEQPTPKSPVRGRKTGQLTKASHLETIPASAESQPHTGGNKRSTIKNEPTSSETILSENSAPIAKSKGKAKDVTNLPSRRQGRNTGTADAAPAEKSTRARKRALITPDDEKSTHEVDASLSMRGGKKAKLELVPLKDIQASPVPHQQKAGAKRGKKSNNVESEHAVPAKQSKSSANANTTSTSNSKPTRSSKLQDIMESTIETKLPAKARATRVTKDKASLPEPVEVKRSTRGKRK